MNSIFEKLNEQSMILISLAVVMLAGFFFTRLTKLIKLPNVSGYILAGTLIGPHLLNIIPQNMLDNMSFVSDIALAFIAFSVGQFFNEKALRETGVSMIIITLFESLLAGIMVSVMMYFVFRLDIGLSLLLGAIATATAPASTIMTINQYHAGGKFVDTLLQVVALDDVVCLLVFSIAAAIVNGAGNGAISISNILLPIICNIAMIAVGMLFALLLNKLLWPHRSTDNRLIIVVAMLLCLSGLCSIFEISPLLSCMVFSAVYVNKAQDKKLYHQLNVFTPPIMLIFFVISGMNLNFKTLADFGIIGIVYFIIRIAGKYLGAYLGCITTKSDKSMRNYLGVALIPQAGVAIGLAYLAQRILPKSIGNILMTIILASSVLYELIGPACAKIALIKSGAIPSGKTKLTDDSEHSSIV
ncbi:MAG: cation:proton antiporter [Clostridia bacterium]